MVPLHQPFDTALRGFHRRQVLEHLESLDGRITMVAADRDAALAQVADLSKVLNHLCSESELLEHLRREAEKANSQVERMLKSPMAEAGARIERVMRLAEEEAAELKARAEGEIAAERARADQDIAELRACADQEITRLRACVSSETESLFEHTKRHCERLEADSARRLEVAEQDAARAIAERDSEASARIQGNDRRSIARLHLMLQAVGEQLATRVCAVEQDEAALRELRAKVATEVTALAALRTEVTAALATTHQILTDAIGQVGQITVEHPDVAVQVPTQRSAAGGTVYLLNASAEERRAPRAPS